MSEDKNLPDNFENNNEYHSEDDNEHVDNRGDETDMNEDDAVSINTRGQLEDLGRQLHLMNSRLESIEREKRVLVAENKRLKAKKRSKSSNISDPMRRIPRAKSGEISSKTKITPKVASKGKTTDKMDNSMRSKLKRAQAAGYDVSRKHMRLLNKGTEEQKQSLMKELTKFVSSKRISNVPASSMVSRLRVSSNSSKTKKRSQSSSNEMNHDDPKKMKLSDKDIHEGDLSLLNDLDEDNEEEDTGDNYVGEPDEKHDDFNQHKDDDEDGPGNGLNINVNLDAPLQILQK